MHFREKVEEIMIKRLCRRTPQDAKIPDQAFKQLTKRLESMINWLARDRKILGFTEEDLRSFMLLKLHQVLRRRLYDDKQSQYRFFIKVFNNLFNDINRCKNEYLKNENNKDALDDCVSYDDKRNVGWKE